jgi:hypothetical protein
MSFKSADRFAGTYRIDGLSADGANYFGSATVTAKGLFGHISAIIEPKIERHGLAVLAKRRLLVAWGPKDKVEIGAYTIQGDSMQGIWIPPAASGNDLSACGQEKSVRVAENEWRIEQAFDLEHKPYTGTISVQVVSDGTPRIVEILWRLHDGEYRSFGLLGEGWMASTFNFEPGSPNAIAAYERIPDGFKGVQLWKDQRTLGHETLIAPAKEAASGSLGKRGAA